MPEKESINVLVDRALYEQMAELHNWKNLLVTEVQTDDIAVIAGRYNEHYEAMKILSAMVYWHDRGEVIDESWWTAARKLSAPNDKLSDSHHE